MSEWTVVLDVRWSWWSYHQCRASVATTTAHIHSIWSPSRPVCSVCHAGYVWGLGAEVRALLNSSDNFWGFGSVTFASQALPHLLIQKFLHFTWVETGMRHHFLAGSICWRCREHCQLFTTVLPGGTVCYPAQPRLICPSFCESVCHITFDYFVKNLLIPMIKATIKTSWYWHHRLPSPTRINLAEETKGPRKLVKYSNTNIISQEKCTRPTDSVNNSWKFRSSSSPHAASVLQIGSFTPPNIHTWLSRDTTWHIMTTFQHYSKCGALKNQCTNHNKPGHKTDLQISLHPYTHNLIY